MFAPWEDSNLRFWISFTCNTHLTHPILFRFVKHILKTGCTQVELVMWSANSRPCLKNHHSTHLFQPMGPIFGCCIFVFVDSHFHVGPSVVEGCGVRPLSDGEATTWCCLWYRDTPNLQILIRNKMIQHQIFGVQTHFFLAKQGIGPTFQLFLKIIWPNNVTIFHDCWCAQYVVSCARESGT